MSGTWMYNAASGWLMTSLNPEPLIVSLVQVATTLPIFLFAVPAGALADIVDKRRFLIIGEVAVTAVSAVFAAIVALGAATPGNLLLFTFLIGAVAAMTAIRAAHCGYGKAIAEPPYARARNVAT